MEFPTQTANQVKPTKRVYRSKIQKPKKQFQTSSGIDIGVSQVIERINAKINRAKIQSLHPPFFQKSLTKFRDESYSYKLKAQIDQKIHGENFKAGRNLLMEFVTSFDDQYIDYYVEQIREPYTRKIFNQGYEIDKVNFKKLNTQYELRKEISEVINQTAEWLIQMEITQDLLNRVHLYFDVPYKPIMEHLKNQGSQCRNGGWFSSLGSLIRKTSSYTLRKSSRVVQNSFYATCISPAFAMLTWAIIGGNSNLPWNGGIDTTAFLVPIIAFTVPYILDSMAQNIQRNDFQAMLINWAIQFETIVQNIRNFNNLIEKQINACVQAENYEIYQMHVINIEKYVDNLTKNISRVSEYNEEIFEEMRQRTKAYFMEYIEIQEGQWTTVLTPEQFEEHSKELQAKKNEHKQQLKDINKSQDEDQFTNL